MSLVGWVVEQSRATEPTIGVPQWWVLVALLMTPYQTATVDKSWPSKIERARG